jgi:hypothetical protein
VTTLAAQSLLPMTKEQHLDNLREQYISLSRQYLVELQTGKSIRDLKDIRDTIAVLVGEIEVMENDIESAKRNKSITG